MIVADVPKKSTAAILNIGNKFGEEMAGFITNNPAIKVKKLNRLEFYTSAVLPETKSANGRFYYYKKKNANCPRKTLQSKD